MRDIGEPEQMDIALGWLGVFFAVYLVLPLLYQLLKKASTYKEDVLLVLSNAVITFYYLWTILFANYRTELAFCAVGLCVVHLVMMAIVSKRMPADINARLALLAIGLFFLTIAIPLYFRMYSVAMAWSCEAVVLLIIALRYRSTLTQVASAAAFILSILRLMWQLPLHSAAFKLVFNEAFGSWLFVAIMLYFAHILYRSNLELPEELKKYLAQVFYATAGIVLLAAMTMEWNWHCRYNLAVNIESYASKGQMVIFTIMMLLFVLRPLYPKGKLSMALGLIFVAAGSISAIVAVWHLHNAKFTAFANVDFMLVLGFIAAVLIYHIKYRFFPDDKEILTDTLSEILYGLAGAMLLFAICAEWYYYCEYNVISKSGSYVAKGLAVIFAVMMPVFVMRPLSPKGVVGRLLAAILAAGGSIFIINAFTSFHTNSFTIFGNIDFAIAMVFVASIFAVSLVCRRQKEEKYSKEFSAFLGILGVVVLWVLMTQEIYEFWYCKNRYAGEVANWNFLANMYISVMWAVYAFVLMLVGFWKNIGIMRYMSLGLFALLLGKVFIFDMATVKSVYRVAAFMATGITLVGVSYLYQYLRKKGFFEVKTLTSKDPD